MRNVVLWCDVQLTKDGAGICLPDINLENATNIGHVFPNNATNYAVNGIPTRGYFSVDYTTRDLTNVTRKFAYFPSYYFNIVNLKYLMVFIVTFSHQALICFFILRLYFGWFSD